VPIIYIMSSTKRKRVSKRDQPGAWLPWQADRVLTPILATEDPYLAAAIFVRCGWELFLETPRDSDDRLAGVALGAAQLLLGTDDPAFLDPRDAAHRGAGVELHVTVPPDRIDDLHVLHREHAEATSELREQPWGERAFHATVCGYRFLVAAEVADEAEPS
jgi:hypothetical protein